MTPTIPTLQLILLAPAEGINPNLIQSYYQNPMYKAASSEILNKISKIFPGAMFSDVNSHHDHFSLNDLIDQIVQRLPLPAEVETNSAILNMKDVVDGQELKIQKNMIHLEDECSPCKSEAVWMKEEPHEHSYWNPEEQQSHIMSDKFLNYLI